MANSDLLFDLIASLSPKEKRNFSAYANRQNRGKSPGYWKLYQAMVGEPVYDEDKILAKLKGEKMLRQLAVAKHYLTELILSSLVSFHQDSTIEMEIRGGLNRIEVLFAKGQRELVRKTLNKTWKMAQQFEFSTYQLELLGWFLRLERMKKSNKLAERLGEYAELQRQVTAQIQAESNLRLMHDELYILVQSAGPSPHPRAEARMQEIMHAPEVLNPLPLTFHAKVIRQYVFVLYNLIRQDPAGIEQAFRGMVSLWKAYPHQIKARPEKFFTMLFSHCDSCFQSGNFSHYEDSLHQLKTLQGHEKMNSSKVFYMSNHLELRYFVFNEKYQEAESLITHFESEMDQYPPDWNSSLNLTFYYNILQTLFLNKNYSKANKWVLEIINYPNIDARKDIQQSARIFQLILQFELGNFDILESLIKSAERYLAKERNLMKAEKEIINSLKLMIKDPGQAAEIFKLLLDQIGNATTPLLGLDNIATWLRGKIEQKN